MRNLRWRNFGRREATVAIVVFLCTSVFLFYLSYTLMVSHGRKVSSNAPRVGGSPEAPPLSMSRFSSTAEFMAAYDASVANVAITQTHQKIVADLKHQLVGEKLDMQRQNKEFEGRIRQIMRETIEEEKRVREKNMVAANNGEGVLLCDNLNVTNQRIPRHVMLVWKNETLFPSAAALDEEWRRKEPCFARRVVTDEECRRLANAFPGMQPHFDNFPLNVMRADTCRVLAVYSYGGVFMDLDIKWMRPFESWLDLTAPIFFGNESDDGHHFCNWFFAAERHNPCLRRVIETIISRFDALSWDEIKQRPHFVTHVTGPRAFTDGIRGCAVPQMTREEIRNSNILHIYGSQRWKTSKGYSSWMEWRSEAFVWHQLLLDDIEVPNYVRYVLQSQAETLREHAPGAEGARALVASGSMLNSSSKPAVLKVSNVVLAAGGCDLFVRGDMQLYANFSCYHPPRLMFDGSLDSFAVLGPQRWEKPLTFFKLVFENAVPHTSVQCVKLFATKYGNHRALRRTRAVWVGTRNEHVAVTEYANTEHRLEEPVVTFTFPPPSASGAGGRSQTTLVSAIIIERNDDEFLEIAEMMIFGDLECRGPPATIDGELVAVNLEEKSGRFSADMNPRTPLDALWLFTTMISFRDGRCDDMRQFGRFVDDYNIWGLCVDAPLALANRSVVDVDSIAGGYHFKSNEVVKDSSGRVIGTKPVIQNISQAKSAALDEWRRQQKGRPCHVLSIAHTHYHSLQAALLQMGCEVVHVDGLEDEDFRHLTRGKLTMDSYGRHVVPHRASSQHKATIQFQNDYEGKRRQLTDIPTLMEGKNWSHIDVLVLDYDKTDPLFFDDIFALADNGQLDQLLIELHLPDNEFFTDTLMMKYIDPLNELRKRFHLVSSSSRGQIHYGWLQTVATFKGGSQDVRVLQKHKLTFLHKKAFTNSAMRQSGGAQQRPTETRH